VADLVLASAGTLNVTLTLTNSAGSASLTKTYVVVPEFPIARIEVPTSVDVDQPVTFKDLSAFVPAGAVRRWKFGPASDWVAGSAEGATHTFTTPGTFDVILQLSILDIPITDTHVTVTVKPALPRPTVAASVNGAAAVTDPVVSVKTGDKVTFTDQSNTPLPESRAWSVDGEAAGSAATFERTFTTAGAHTVRLVSSNSAGSSEATMTIMVSGPAAPAAAPSIGAATT
jgi:PKD repeat protein